MTDIEPTGDAVERDDPFVDQPDEDFRESRAPVTVRGVAIVGARVVTGAIGIGVAAAAIAVAALVPLPRVASQAPSELVVPVPTAQQLVCAGPLLRLSDESGQEATQASPIGVPELASDSSSGAVTSDPLDQSDAGSGGTDAAPRVISTPPNEADPSERILLSGAQSQSVSDGDFVGLAAADCGVASADVWLAGGATTVGRTTLLTLNNPTEVPATVDLELFGENGPIVAPGTSGIVVPPSGQRVLSLAGFAPDVESPVVHVTSAGGQVVAELQQSIVRGLVAGGAEIVGPTQSPSLETVIPGLVISGGADIEENLGLGPGFEDLQTVLRVFVPGEEPAQATIRVIPEDGVGTGTSFEFEFDAGLVQDVPIPDLADGTYTVRVDSEVPLLAAARASAASGDGTDVVWLPAAPALGEVAAVTIAPGPSPRLHLANPTTAPVTVELVGADGGDDSEVEVAAGAAVSVSVDPGASYVLSGFDRLFASVSLVDGAQIAGYVVRPPGVGSSPILIYP
ncbi:DUF5719 family protein [Salinibacterium soli]|uniref:DUF5719 family protein n=1 Tax=Antiquaquibacter soli TaxID=3064523 RepID=A0ABT9BJF2_9MICO|nr:DUF5719 family protein [Protaetiibacter sp. WY-16]MDO7881147.1 DUF5719 family protein [Protaetiibacter sp. WY-16]